MARILEDTLRTLNLVEEENAVRSMTREFLVTDLTRDDWSVLELALSIAGVPKCNSSPDGYANLRLKGRVANLEPGTNDTVRVQLLYTSYGQDDMNFALSGKTQLVQVQTQRDRFGNPIVVGYTFPDDYKYDNTLRGQSVENVATVTVPMPMFTLSGNGNIATNHPLELSRSWLNTLNSDFWAGSGAGTWCCTKFDYSPLQMNPLDLQNPSRPPLFKFQVEFTLNPVGWPIWASFIDPNTGQPPNGLIPGIGLVTPEWFAWRDFGEMFPEY
jgi:hypothetical protein